MITTNFSTSTATILVNNTTFVLSLNQYKTDEVQAAIKAFKEDQDSNLELLLAVLTKTQDAIEEEVIMDTFVHDLKRDKYFFKEDTNRRFELPSLLVDYLEEIIEKAGNTDIAKPIINMFKKLVKNPFYSISFAYSAMEAILNDYNDQELNYKLLNSGYAVEVAYDNSSKHVFTLTEDGKIVAYKSALFKNHKFDTTTGERIPRFPVSYDEELGYKIVDYPATAEGYKIFFTGKKYNELQQVGKETFFNVGQVVNQSCGQPGFEKEHTSVRFYGFEQVKNAKIERGYDEVMWVKVLIDPVTITSFGARMDNISSPIFMITEFSKAPSENTIDVTKLDEASKAYVDKFINESKESIEAYYNSVKAKISDWESL